MRVERASLVVTGGTTAPDWTNAVSGPRVSLAQSQALSVVTNSANVYLYQENQGTLALLKTLSADERGIGLQLNGFRSDPIAFADGGNLAFIAGRNGKVYMLDMTSLAVVHTIEIGSGGNISSLAVADGWLYVAEGARIGGGPGRLTRIDLHLEAGRFLTVQQLTGLPSAPAGYLDLAVSGNRYLAVTAPAQPPNFTAGNAAKGNAYVIDLRDVGLGTGVISAYRTVGLDNLGARGKGPQYIAPGAKPGEFVLSDALDHSGGFVSIHFDLTSTGALAAQPQVLNADLHPTEADWTGKPSQQNIQRAQGIVYTVVDGKEYALVADFNLLVNDANFINSTLGEKKIGGKIGVILDPFGRAGGPRYLGATAPISGGSIDKLALSSDGKFLYSNVVIDEMLTGSGTRISQSLYVWDAQVLVRSALARTLVGAPLTVPIAVDPMIRLSGSTTNQNDRFDWIFGVAGAVKRDSLTADPVRYGDISKMDLAALIEKADPSLKGSVFTDFQVDAFSLGTVVIDPKTKIIVSNDALGNSADVSTTGVFYLAPAIGQAELDRLRQGGRLGDMFAKGAFTVNVDGVQRAFRINVPIVDYASAVGAVFFGDRDLQNPGYSEFKIASDVGIGSTNALDVYRVEQRLKYLGFTAFGADMTNGTQPLSNRGTLGIPKEFKVDGVIGKEEQSALQAFYAATHYSTYQKSPNASISPITNSSSGNYGMQTTLTSTAATIVPKAASNPNDPADDTNLEWLNAYNAPHWVNVYKALDIPTDARTKKSSSGNFIDGTKSKMEIYSTSWSLDLLKAWEISKPQLVAQGLISATTMLQLNGLTDPTYGEPLHDAGGHSVGMSIDLGVGTYISKRIQDDPLNGGITPPTITASDGWSIQIAKDLSAPPNLPSIDGNDQSRALRNFLSLYAVTQTPSVNGTLLSLPFKNAPTTWLFGSGAQNGQQLIQNVWIGGTGTANPYKGINNVLDKLRFVKAYGLHHANFARHQSHFHVDLRAPVRVGLPEDLLADTPSKPFPRGLACSGACRSPGRPVGR